MRTTLAVMGAALGCLLYGCGYTVGFNTPPGVQTIAVDVVANASYRQRLERDLTRAIDEEIQEYSNLRRAPRSRADAILEVEILAVRNTTLMIGVTTPVGEGSIDTIAHIRLIERRTGAVLVDRQLRDIAEYRTLIGEDESSARSEMVSDLGRAIVLALDGSF